MRAGGADTGRMLWSLPQDNVFSPLSGVCKEQQKPEEGATEPAGHQGGLLVKATFGTDSGGVGVSEGGL